MAEKPILFSAPMIRAILAGTKTQTRRVVKPQPVGPIDPLVSFNHGRMEIAFGRENRDPSGVGPRWWRPAAQVGDTFWVRESHYMTDDGDSEYAIFAADEERVRQHLAIMDGMRSRLTDERWRHHTKLRPSIHLPRWASRILLTVTDVRVERLNDITEADALAEGVKSEALGEWVNCGFIEVQRANCPPVTCFASLWMNINGAESWGANPWVFAYTFERVQP